jgi:hypothetical protein
MLVFHGLTGKTRLSLDIEITIEITPTVNNGDELYHEKNGQEIQRIFYVFLC